MFPCSLLHFPLKGSSQFSQGGPHATCTGAIGFVAGHGQERVETRHRHRLSNAIARRLTCTSFAVRKSSFLLGSACQVLASDMLLGTCRVISLCLCVCTSLFLGGDPGCRIYKYGSQLQVRAPGESLVSFWDNSTESDVRVAKVLVQEEAIGFSQAGRVPTARGEEGGNVVKNNPNTQTRSESQMTCVCGKMLQRRNRCSAQGVPSKSASYRQYSAPKCKCSPDHMFTKLRNYVQKHTRGSSLGIHCCYCHRSCFCVTTEHEQINICVNKTQGLRQLIVWQPCGVR